MVSRRKFMLGGLGLAAIGSLALRPGNDGGAYSQYFAGLNQMLREAGIGQPSLLIDLDRLDQNIDLVRKSVGTTPQKKYRVVVKSVPSLHLSNYIAMRADTNAFMVFHRPFLNDLALARPDADVLLGKPMPVSAAAEFYRVFDGASAFDPQQQLKWLIDTPKRLQQYLQLAKSLNTRMRVSLEIDVGLHRGGFDDRDSFVEVLNTIAANQQSLQFAGLMGYDAHLMGMPGFLADREFPKVVKKYQGYVDLARETHPNFFKQPLCFNGAGSPTFRRYEGQSVLNDVSAGSCLMKPSHYDLPILQEFVDTAHIATPVLKKMPNRGLPSLEWASRIGSVWNPNSEMTYFVYSGNWMAHPESPPGLSLSSVYRSSNQQGLHGSAAVKLAVDDFVFFRPEQSEAVLLQFGDLLAVRGNEIVERWPVLDAST
mgnify:CR=1 FL=1